MFITHQQAEETAESVSRLFHSLRSKGFSSENAMEIVVAFIRKGS